MRLFIAFPLEMAVKERLDHIITELKSYGAPVKWVAAKNIHLTARFLGETAESLVSQIKSELDAIAGNYRGLDTDMNRVGGFPNLNRPRVIWVGLDKNTEQLTKIATRVELAVQDLGFEPERKKFRPHLTIGRVRDGRGIEKLTEHLQSFRIEPMPLKFDRLVLFKSTLTTQGPIYDRLHEAMLKA